MQRKTLYTLFAIILVFAFRVNALSQSNLNKTISIDVNRQRVEDVLEIISNQGNFYFSYNSNIIKKDSLVTISARNKSVKQVLDMIFRSGYEYKESGNYLIIRRMPIKLTLVTNQAVSDDKNFIVSGYIIDEQTGEKVSDATIYEKEKLLSAISNDKGYFKLKIKNKYKSISLTVSKQYYQDTTVSIQPNFNQQISITIMPIDITDRTIIISPQSERAPDSIYIAVQQPDSSIWLYTYKKLDSSLVETSTFGRLLLSSRQKIQSINLNKFFTARPYQVSVFPGLSSNGKLNAQVINNFSVNIFGGYSGGVNGMELGGFFNIDKKDVKYFQAAGLLNSVGKSVTGVQLAGISNTVMDSVMGVQVSGITNFVKNNFRGVQLGGIYSHVAGSTKGLQASGIANYTNHHFEGLQLGGIGNISHDVKGAQIAGIANITNNANGIQLAGIVNYTKKLKGVQIGLINIADTSEGLSIGLINIIFNGYHKLAIYNNEVTDFNIAYKSGNKKLYSILTGGLKLDNEKKAYTFGYGIGSDISFTKRFGINPEIVAQQVFLGDWERLNLLVRYGVNVHFNITKNISIFAGPVYNLYYSKQAYKIDGYESVIPSESYHVTKINNTTTGWIGWNAGITIF